MSTSDVRRQTYGAGMHVILVFFAFLWIDVLFNGTLFIGTLQKANCQMMNNLRVLFLTILLEIFVPVGRQKKRASANCKNGTR